MEIPRRIRVDLMTPSELAIRAAVLAVEEAGCDTRLTDAVILLQQAKEKVADFVDGVAAKRNPFSTADGMEWVDSESRLDRVKGFDAEECRAALELATGLQKTVKLAIERRLRRLAKGAA